MKSHYLFLLFVFFLMSCAPSTPAPTTTPVPTATITPSPTPVPETWVSGVEDSGIELSTELFDSIKDQTPVLSADGNQVLNAETSEVLLEKKDGVWQAIEPDVVTTAMNEYGMPREMASQLEGLDVSFGERVGCVLIKDNETNKILFRVVSNEWQTSTASYSENDSIDKFRNPENSIPSDDVSYMGEYWQWAKREIAPRAREWFMAHEDEIIDGIEGEEDSAMIWIGVGGFMIPKRFTTENFSRNELPFSGHEVFHNTKLKFTESRTFESIKGGSISADAGDEWLHTVIPFFLYNRKTQEVSVIVTVAKRPHESTINDGNLMLEQMNVLPLSITPADVSGFTNPIVEKAFAESGLSAEEITQLMLLFSQGDVTALDGFVLNTKISNHEIFQ